MTNDGGPVIVLTVNVLRDHVGPEVAAKLDLLGFRWQEYIDNIRASLSIIADMKPG
jgi:hypothetical protein